MLILAFKGIRAEHLQHLPVFPPPFTVNNRIILENTVFQNPWGFYQNLCLLVSLCPLGFNLCPAVLFLYCLLYVLCKLTTGNIRFKPDHVRIPLTDFCDKVGFYDIVETTATTTTEATETTVATEASESATETESSAEG